MKGDGGKRQSRETTEDCRIDSVRMATTLRPAPCHWGSVWAGRGSLLLPDWLTGPAAREEQLRKNKKRKKQCNYAKEGKQVPPEIS